MRRSRWLSLAMVLVLLASTGALVGAGPPPGRPTPVVVSILGVAQVQGRDVLVEVIVVVPRGADPNEVALAALREQGGRPFESDEFSITGLVWDQFSDHIPGNDFVTQWYNPEDDPTASGLGETALTNSHVTWTGVTTSQFAFDYGGETSRCPSLVRECPDRQVFDGNNDVAWLELRPNILGVTWFSTSTDEADMALSTRYSWSTDYSSGYDVETVFLHENGHVVGLGHSEDEEAVMWPYYEGVLCILHDDDVQGITYLYPAAVATGTIAGTVTNASDGTAIEGATVTVDTGQSATTAAAGTYTIADVLAGERSVTASADGFESQTKTAAVTADLPTTVDFALNPIPVGSIAGTVTNAADGTTISGATVSVDTGQSATTGADGKYTITDVPTGDHSVTASAEGFESQTTTAPVTEGKTATVDFVLNPVTTADTVSVDSITYAPEGGRDGKKHLNVTVALVDNLGKPVSGASVSIDVYVGGSLYASGTGTTGTEGTVTFKLPNAPSGDYTTTVTDVTAEGLTWDGITPPNDLTK